MASLLKRRGEKSGKVLVDKDNFQKTCSYVLDTSLPKHLMHLVH